MSTIDDVIAKRHAELLKRSNTRTVAEIVRQRMSEPADIDARADSAPATPHNDKRSPVAQLLNERRMQHGQTDTRPNIPRVNRPRGR